MNITESKTLNLQTDKNASKSPKNDVKNTDFSKELENIKIDKNSDTIPPKSNDDLENAVSGLNDTIDKLQKLNQKDEQDNITLKKELFDADIKNKYEEFGLIDNNMNIQEPQDKLNLQMGTNMDFNSNEQQFAEFVNQEKSKDILKSTAKDLAEERAVMSTMEENIAIANKNMAIARTKIVENEHGVQKVDKKTELVVDTIVRYDSIIMDKADVEFFANIVENGVADLNEVATAQKSSQVSKTLADMLAKAMNENKPIRIDFDNDISIIIKIDKAGKISADFLPSSQVAEAYLKENLPLLRQRFDDNNINYNELNQRQGKQNSQQNKKKDGKNE